MPGSIVKTRLFFIYEKWQLETPLTGCILPKRLQAGSGVHPAFYLLGTEIFTRGYSGQGVKLSIQLLFSAEVMNEWSYLTTPPICLHFVGRENF